MDRVLETSKGRVYLKERASLPQVFPIQRDTERERDRERERD